MSCRRMFARWGLLSFAFVALAAWDSRAQAQSTGGSRTGGGSSGGSGGSGSSASAPGGGFTGGGGSTSSGGFTGGGSTSSGGFTGGAGFNPSAGLGGTGTGTAVPSAVNPFTATYVNPLSVGMVNVTGKATVNKPFGQAMFSVYSTATTGGTGTLGGLGSSGSAGYGFNTYGMGRTVSYTATLGDSVPLVVQPNPQLQASLTAMLQRSSAFQTPAGLKVQVKGPKVYIEGTVASAKEKRIAEGLVRLTPGVRDVVNNLEVSETLPQPKTTPLGP